MGTSSIQFWSSRAVPHYTPASSQHLLWRNRGECRPAGYVAMLFIQTLFLCSALCPVAVLTGVISTTPSNLENRKKTSKNFTPTDKKNKRLIDAQTATLLQAGVLLADYPLLEYGNSFYQPHDQFNHSGTYFPQYGSAVLHRDEAPLVASRHPTKPVYHYTPLPPGTFPEKTIPYEKRREEESRPNNHYWYDYLVRDGELGLDLGQKEARQGDIVRGIYHVLLPDRRTQVVQYWSDWSGYHPTISYS